MNKILKNLTLAILILFLNSCSLAFLASKQQNIKIEKDSTIKLTIDEKQPVVLNGKYSLIRDSKPKQLVVKKDGYKTENRVIVPYKPSALFFSTLGLNGIVGCVIANSIGQSLKADLNPGSIPFMTLAGGWFGLGGGALACYMSPRLMNYQDSINLNYTNQLKILRRDSTMKELFLNKVSIDIPSSCMKYQLISYRNYLKENNKYKTNSKKDKDIKINNSIFSDELNNLLKQTGFIDTSGNVLKGSYNENLFLNTTITEFKYSLVYTNPIKGASSNYLGDLYYTFSNLKLKTKWDVLDIYKNIIYSDTLELQSGELVEENGVDDSYNLKKHINDALESGLYRLMNSEKFRSVMALSKTVVSENLTEFEVPKSFKYVESLEDAVNATATLKTKNGHGSCFFISENGYLITNYHVISDSSKLEVVLNDGSKFKASIIRFNKDADLALLKIDKNGLIPFNIASNDQLNMGKEIYVIGTPSAEDLSQTLSKGIISSVRKQSNGSKVIQTDASVNPGNSGGPLVDSNGSLLGVVNSKLSGIGIEGISFSIPASTIIPTLKLKINN